MKHVRFQLQLLILIIMMASSIGCAAWERGHRVVVDHHRARKALCHDCQVPEAGSHTGDFKKGYVAGYVNVANGGDGRPPILPPRKYASAKYRGPKGRERANAWFHGFQYGALSAERCGARELHYLPVSPAFCPTNAELVMHDAGIVTHDGAAAAPWQPHADAGNASVHGGEDATPGQIPPPEVKTPATDQPAGSGGTTDATNQGEDDRGDRENDNDKNGYSADDLFSVSFTRPSAPCGRGP